MAGAQTGARHGERFDQELLPLADAARRHHHFPQHRQTESNLEVTRRQHLPFDRQGRPQVRFRLARAAHRKQQATQAVFHPRHRRMFGAIALAPNGQRLAVEGFRFAVAPPVFEQRGEVVELHGVVRMRRAQALAGTGERRAVERLGRGQLALVVE